MTEVSRSAKRGRMFASLEVRDYRYLWAGSLCSSFAMNIQMVARGYLIYEMTHSAGKLAWVTLAFMLPQVFFSLVGGVLADRLPKKALMIGAQSLNCIGAILMASIVFTEQVQFWHFIALGIFNGTLLALSMPSRQSIIPEVVGESQLMNAIALNASSMQLSRILGPAVSGGLISLFHVQDQIPFMGVGIVYVIIAVLYAGAAISVRFVRISGQSERRAAQSILGDIGEGFSYIRNSRLMLGLVIMGTFPMMFGMPMQNLMPAFSRSVLHGGPDDLGLLMTCLGIGALIGTLTLARAGEFEGKGKALFLGCGAWGIFILMFTLADTFGPAAVLTGLAGMFSSSLMALNRTMMQLESPPAMRGRIMSFDQMAHGLMPVGILPIGFLSDAIGVAHALQVSAAILLAITLVAYRWMPEVWNFSAGDSHR